MEAVEARSRYHEMLREKVRDTMYPSAPMLDRVEREIRSREDAEAYVDVLFEKVDAENYPSIQIMDRLGYMIDLLERAARLEEQAAQAS
jgi:hypothetical protein